MFDVKLIMPMCDDKRHIELQKDIRLPFAPYPHCHIGLEPHSRFQCDEFEIRRVMWHHVDGKFLCELEEHRYEHVSSGVIAYVKAGWRLRPGFESCDTEDDALELSEDSEYVVELEGQFWILRPFEFEVLKLDGREFRVVQEPANDE